MTMLPEYIRVNPNEQFFLGPDVRTLETVVVPARDTGLVTVHLSPGSLPPIRTSLDKYIEELHFDGRSRLALRAGTVDGRKVKERIFAHVQSEGLGFLQQGLDIPMEITNHGQRPIGIPAGPIGKFYRASEDGAITGISLAMITDSCRPPQDRIQVGGENGIDREFNDKGIYTRISNERFCIRKSDEPFWIDYSEEDYRSRAREDWVEAPKTSEEIVTFGQIDLRNPEGVVVVIDSHPVVAIHGERAYELCGRQMNACVVERTNWPDGKIIVELIGPNASVRPNFVFLHFYRVER